MSSSARLSLHLSIAPSLTPLFNSLSLSLSRPPFLGLLPVVLATGPRFILLSSLFVIAIATQHISNQPSHPSFVLSLLGFLWSKLCESDFSWVDLISWHGFLTLLSCGLQMVIFFFVIVFYFWLGVLCGWIKFYKVPPNN